MDIAAQLPHAALRVYVMGERGANREPATADDIAQMRVLAREAAAAGAIGFSTSRTLNHRSSKGAPTPSLTAEVDELVGIAMGLKDAGRGVLELISDFGDLDDEFGIVERMAAASGRPISISLAQGLSPNGWKKILGRIQSNVVRRTRDARPGGAATDRHRARSVDHVESAADAAVVLWRSRSCRWPNAWRS